MSNDRDFIYRGRSSNCCCSHNRYRCEDIIREGACDIREGLGYICEAICGLQNEDAYEGVAGILEGLRNMEDGLEYIASGIRCSRNMFSCQKRRLIMEGVCDIQDGISCINHGVKEIVENNMEEGLIPVTKGVLHIENGLCDILKALTPNYQLLL